MSFLRPEPLVGPEVGRRVYQPAAAVATAVAARAAVSARRMRGPRPRGWKPAARAARKLVLGEPAFRSHEDGQRAGTCEVGWGSLREGSATTRVPGGGGEELGE